LEQANHYWQGEGSLDAPTTEPDQNSKPDDSTRSPDELFRYSSWVHAGHGAKECEQREAGCSDPQHVHAWVRLPNQFQHQEIRERALAAKARRIRQLRDPETDAHVVLEADLEEIRHDREVLVSEIVGKEWWKRHLDAMAAVEEDEQYEHIERDRERLAEIRAMPEDEQPADELGELERHFGGYSEKIEVKLNELEAPAREAAEAMDVDELVKQVREDRITAEGSSVFMDVYAKHEWFAGSYTNADPIARQRRFAQVGDLEEAAPEVIDALRRAFGELETSLQRGPRGN
jgi:HAMP domain-containing protein